MKRILGMSAILCSLFFVNVFGAEPVLNKTNIVNTQLLPAYDSSVDYGFIKYDDGSEEIIKDDYVGLFINGSIIKNAGIIIENSRALVPVRLISEEFNANVEWIPETREVKIYDNSNNISLKIENIKANINGKEILLDTPPKIINSSTYVPIRFVTEALGANVNYFDGNDLSKTHIIVRIPHIMISRYDKNVKPMTREQCIQIVKEQLITAYEKRYGVYKPFSSSDTYVNDGDDIRKAISNLTVTDENDRYYVIPVVFDFWVDKYTGDVYVFYNGQTMSITSFDPSSPGALTFAG